ncbi:putative fusion protein: putative acetyltransferase protein and hypothetical conserved protein [Rhizobium etli CIAT 652]|uniref:UPF0178 protein RHECIAT_CH0002338 n=2 Tax=Rhizobium TaxID=379 RepID=B3PP06_RHIE6|nr:putative fusion protein: putative acetyltransferase protein and hypothetical conserved protein [Rhizobium etli CIAT 652]
MRVDVFVVEQNCPYPELDGKDIDALHLRLMEGGELLASARILKPHEPQDPVKIGRVVVSPAHRGKRLGDALMSEAISACERLYPANSIALSAQAHLRRFYEAFGFVVASEEYLEDGIPHIDMIRQPVVSRHEDIIMIYVDADACPVKPEVLKVAERHGLEVTFVANSGLRPSRDAMVHNVIVSNAFDAADNWIAEHAGPGDVVVTADVPLAVRCVAAGAFVSGPTGRVFDETNIGMASAMRDLGAHLRETGESKGYNAAFSPKDRSRFLETFDRLCRRAKSLSAEAGGKP